MHKVVLQCDTNCMILSHKNNRYFATRTVVMEVAI